MHELKGTYIVLGYVSCYEYAVIESWSGGYNVVATFSDEFSAMTYVATKNQQSDGSIIYSVSKRPVWTM